MFGDLIEIAQDRPIRRRSEWGTMTVLSRVGRIYCSLPPGELLARNACAATLGKLASQCELSDHVPVVARVCGKSLVSGYRPFVPGWVLGLPCFPDLVRDLAMAEGVAGPGSEDLAPFEKLRELKRVVVKAARRAAEEAGTGECDSPSACLHWIARARSSVRACDLDRLRDIVGRAPRLSPFFDCVGGVVVDPHALQQFSHSCVRDEINEQIKELRESELPGEETVPRMISCMLASRLDRRRVGGFRGLLFWGRGAGSLMTPLGTSRGIGRRSSTTLGAVMLRLMPFGGFIQQCPGGLEPISREEFYEICAVNRRFTPGPDGVFHRTWKACGQEAHDVLYDCYLMFMRSGIAPTWFNSARMVFIPKTGDEEYCESVAAEPGDLRPLSLSNCDHKLICVAVCCTLRRMCDSTVHEAQRGFRRGKLLTDNVLSLNAFTERQLILGAPLPTQILMDIKAAFPSVLWPWVFFVLEKMGCPWWLVNAVKALYHGSSVTLSLGSTAGPGFLLSFGALSSTLLFGLSPLLLVILMRLCLPLLMTLAFLVVTCVSA